jgi:hypothetical protein
MPQSSFLYAQEVVKTAADRLDALGQMLYGENWITPMARDLNIPRDMISKWALATRTSARPFRLQRASLPRPPSR